MSTLVLPAGISVGGHGFLIEGAWILLAVPLPMPDPEQLDASGSSRSVLSQQEFLRLFLASERDVRRYVGSLVPNVGDVEEIVQQTAVVLWEKVSAYDPERPFTPWACRFALNVARQWMARQQRWKRLLSGELAETLAQRRRHLQSEFDSRLRHLDDCVKQLPQRQQRMLSDFYFEQRAIEDVARRAEKSVDAVYKAIQRMRKALRTCIEIKQQQEATA